nr:MAG TPA: hypothetical protein [Caudoviricetes sp.]
MSTLYKMRPALLFRSFCGESLFYKTLCNDFGITISSA